MEDTRTTETFRRLLFDVLERSRRGDRMSRIVDIVLVCIILANVAASVLDTVPVIHDRYGFALAVFNVFCVVIFVLEYAGRIWTAPEHPALAEMPAWRARIAHAASPMLVLDLIAISPFVIELFFGADIAVVRILRVIRFYRLARYSPALETIVGVIASEWRSLAGAAVLFVGLLLFSGVAMFLAEGKVQPDVLGDVPKAMWWGVVTLSTVGYGDVVPVTLPGKIVAGLTMVLGIVFFALPVGIIATSYLQQLRRRDFVVSFAMVARVPLFNHLDAAVIARLIGLLTARRAAAGEVIITKGEEADAMYFITSGKVEIELPTGPVYLSEGDFFGEMALVDERQRRSATVIAARTCNLLVLSARDFKHLVHANAEIGEAVNEIARQRRKAHRDSNEPDG